MEGGSVGGRKEIGWEGGRNEGGGGWIGRDRGMTGRRVGREIGCEGERETGTEGDRETGTEGDRVGLPSWEGGQKEGGR